MGFLKDGFIEKNEIHNDKEIPSLLRTILFASERISDVAIAAEMKERRGPANERPSAASGDFGFADSLCIYCAEPDTTQINPSSNQLQSLIAMTSQPTGTIIVTGANGGLGSALVTKVIKEDGPYHSIFTVRGRSAGSSGTVEKLLASVPAPSSSKYEIAELDLSSLTAVRKFAFDISSRVQSGEIPPIRSLVLNAGLQVFKGIKNTEDGYEITFAVNYLANFLLVLLLLKSMDLEHGRIVIVSSFTHDPEFWINASWRPKGSKYMFEEPEKMVHPDPPPPNLDLYIFGMRLYGRSKLLMIMFMYLILLVPSYFCDVSILIRW